jgi:ribosome-associated protein
VNIIDVRGRSSYTDFLVIASGTSDRHVQSVAELVREGLREEGQRPLGSEGLREGQWALLDFGSVVVHVFHPITRQLYDLEELWQDAPRMAIDEKATASRH